MKYLVIGTGGVGGSIGGFLAANGEDVTFIARGKHLEKLKSEGLKIDSGIKGKRDIYPIKAFDKDEFNDKVDVIFVCVKGYSLNEVASLIEKASNENTIVIPLLNGIGTGDKIDSLVEKGIIIDGCIYIVAYIQGPGEILQVGNLFRVVFGPRNNQDISIEKLEEIKNVLCSTGINAILSENIEADTFKKFSFISPYAACGGYYNIAAKDMKTEGVYRETFINLSNEIKNVGEAMGIIFDSDIVSDNLKIVDGMSPENTSSFKRDVASDKTPEVEELIFNVIQLAKRFDVEVPNYRMIAEKFGF